RGRPRPPRTGRLGPGGAVRRRRRQRAFRTGDLAHLSHPTAGAGARGDLRADPRAATVPPRGGRTVDPGRGGRATLDGRGRFLPATAEAVLRRPPAILASRGPPAWVPHPPSGLT